MQQKITNVFQNILRRAQNEDPREEQAVIQRQQEELARDAATHEAFKNLRWTRVISLQEEPAQLTRVWDLGPDIIAELEQMASVEEDLLADLEPYFDPITFQEVTSNPKLEEYRLDPDALRHWGVRATSIREQILMKAQLYCHDDEIPK